MTGDKEEQTVNEEKTLDEKELEEVTGGEVEWPKAQRVLGSCADCALDGKTECPYTDPDIKIRKLTGAELCPSFIPETF